MCKLPNRITQTFDLKRGIKQGDTLSPYLFNLYLNDINHIFSSRECNSSTLGETYVHCLLILSETAQGLQNSLNKLSIYCKTCHLQLNIKKTTVMMFSNWKPETVKFFYDTESLAISDKYTYLGIQFTRNGNLKEAVSVLCDKAMKGKVK